MNIGIKLNSVQFLKVDLRVESFNVEITENLNSEKFTLNTLYNDKDSTAFGIQFEIILKQSDNFYLDIRAIAHFLTDKPYSQEFLDSDFVHVNAPAIAFPYIRTFISNFTLNSGYNPVILPPYNFVEMYRQKKLSETSKITKKSVSVKKKR